MSSIDPQIRRNTERRLARIQNVDMLNNRISALDSHQQLVYISLNTLDPVVAVPMPGESWVIRQQNGLWYLEGRIDTGAEQNVAINLEPGDRRLEASNNLYLNGKNIFFNNSSLEDYAPPGPPGATGPPGPTGSTGPTGPTGPAGSGVSLLSNTTLGADGSFDIPSISGSYDDLILALRVRSARTGSAFDSILMRFNNDSTGSGNYVQEILSAQTSTVSSSGGSGATSMWICNAPSSTATAGFVGQATIEILGYAATSWWKTFVGNGFAQNGSGIERTASGGYWAQTTAVNRIQIFGLSANIQAGSQLRIYGR